MSSANQRSRSSTDRPTQQGRPAHTQNHHTSRQCAAAVYTSPKPKNYNEPDPRLLADLREYSIMYDRDAHGGEYLHFCRPILGGHLFVEVVQRIGGYTGYGRVNAPVGMAAHRRHRLLEHAGPAPRR